jgi:serine/threonine-protein kinase
MARSEDPDTSPDSHPVERRHGARISLTHYQVGEVIGAGGMGEVILAHDPQFGRDIAIKRMRDPAASEEALSRFLREARIQARLDHPAIVPVHELGRDADGTQYFTMKRVSGVTLLDRLAERGAVQPLLRALVDVCFAIDLAHARGIVHRDLKPSNIMLGGYGEVYVLDWGIARDLAEVDVQPPASGPPTPSGTQTGAMLGTPGYIAPEQLRGDRSVGTPVDVYSLGAILFEILAGEPLHSRSDAVASTVQRPTDSPARRQPDRHVAPELDALCVAALAEVPAQRPSARAFADRLQSYLDGDRDVEHRRTLAAAQLATARAALAAGRRSEGIYAAGRALALDPESTEAGELVLELTVAPPQPLPRELEVSLARSEDELHRQRSRRSIAPVLAIFLVAPCALFSPVVSWSPLLALFGATAALAALAYLRGRYGWAAPAPLFLALALVLVVLFSRLAGSLLMTPTLVCALLLVIGARATPRAAPWHVIGFAIISILVPLGLEQLGVFAPTMLIPDGPMILFGSGVFDNWAAPAVRTFGAVFGTAMLTVVVGLYALALTRQLQAARRQIHVQTWALQQLLPRRKS